MSSSVVQKIESSYSISMPIGQVWPAFMDRGCFVPTEYQQDVLHDFHQDEITKMLWTIILHCLYMVALVYKHIPFISPPQTMAYTSIGRLLATFYIICYFPDKMFPRCPTARHVTGALFWWASHCVTISVFRIHKYLRNPAI